MRTYAGMTEEEMVEIDAEIREEHEYFLPKAAKAFFDKPLVFKFEEKKVSYGILKQSFVKYKGKWRRVCTTDFMDDVGIIVEVKSKDMAAWCRKRCIYGMRISKNSIRLITHLTDG